MIDADVSCSARTTQWAAAMRKTAVARDGLAIKAILSGPLPDQLGAAGRHVSGATGQRLAAHWHEAEPSKIPRIHRVDSFTRLAALSFQKKGVQCGAKTQDARMERRLTAILAADVVGYSRLMGGDEVGTLARLQTCRRELVDPAIEEFHGRIVKLRGDGALVEFASVVDAVQCAAAIQRRMAGHDQGAPEAQRIRFRLGVNLGDVIVDGNDIYGDGVNVAARLEGLARISHRSG
jgi:class 3 adenylate cyclase